MQENDNENGVIEVDDITDDWLLSRSVGNPDESSLASTPLNSSKISVRSSPVSTGSSKKRGRRSPGGGSKSASPVRSPSSSKSPSHRPSRFATMPMTEAEGVLLSYIEKIENSSSNVSPNKSPNRAGARYGGVRDSVDGSSHSLISAGDGSPSPSPRVSAMDDSRGSLSAEKKGNTTSVKGKELVRERLVSRRALLSVMVM